MTQDLGKLFQVQRFSVHDGPGIRTTFFLKGCTLCCKWCHNPEGLCEKTQLHFLAERCISCGCCVTVCPNHCHSITDNRHTANLSMCTSCGCCVSACPANALALMGQELTVSEVVKEAKRDLVFYGESGGVTFSGGEALLQADFLSACLKACREAGLHTAVDTAGNYPLRSLEKTVEWTDLYLYDIKAISPDLHFLGTGAGNQQILDNLLWLSEQKKKIWIRIPLIPGFNTNKRELLLIAEWISRLNCIEKVSFIPYHELGREKYRQLDMHYPYEWEKTISADQMKEFKILFAQHGITIKD